MRKNKKVGNSLSDLINLDFGEEEVKEMPKNNENKNNQSQHNKKEEYANAPYNFIEFPDRVVYKYDNIDDLPKHDSFRSDLNTGYIEYDFTNKTPLYIGSGVDGEPFKVDDNHVIPGSTMRGVVRSNAEILSFSYPEFVEDGRFTYRAFAGHKSLRDEYGKKLKEVVTDSNLKLMEEGGIDKKVKAGYIFKYSGEYYIVESINVDGKNFNKMDEFDLKRAGLTSHIEQLYILSQSDKIVIELKEKNEAINDVKVGIKKIYEKIKEEFNKNENLEEVNKLIKALANKYSLFVRNINKSNEKNLKKSIENILLGKDYKTKIKNDVLCKVEKYNKDILDKYGKKAKFRIEKEDLLKQIKYKKDYKLNKIYKKEINTSLLNNLSIRNKLEKEKIEKVVLYNSNDIFGKRSHYLINDISDSIVNKYIISDKAIKEYNNELKNKTFITSLNKELEAKLKKIRSNKTFDILKKEKIKEINNEIREEYSLPEKECLEISKNEIKMKGKIIFFKPYYELKKDEILNKTIANEIFEIKSFGRTPYLRLTYDFSVKDLLDRSINKETGKINYTESIFGFTNKEFGKEKFSYKGRVNFEDVKVEKTKDGKEIGLALMSPKPTSFQLYLEQDKNSPKELNTYNNKKSKLRGQKFYWLREDKIESNTDGKSLIKPIEKGAKFKGKIHFENLSNDELGLLLLSLNYDKDTQESVGMGKPYGYGRIKFDSIKVYNENKQKSFLNFDITEPKELNVEKLKELYKDSIQKEIAENYEDSKSIVSYLHSKHLIVPKEKNEKIRYMNMQKKEFSNRNILKITSELAKELSDKNELE